MENIDASLPEFNGVCGCGPLGNESVIIDDDTGNCLNFQAHYVPTILEPIVDSNDDDDVQISYYGSVDLPPYDAEKQAYKSFFIDVTFHDVDLSTTTMKHNNNINNIDNKEPKTSSVGTWPVSHSGDLEFTTQAVVIPDYFPYPDCEGDACGGSLV
eukprot:CAMPEP_0114356852 /NCGR_PEP_ID=MMETSP0101-20121206/21234_1 /TAXON_ID=38822 ORGANISM="Pteridomonas danica, Strain PT" /NCGR_SAMPLE_ID=MMETSP0101 /ASSEMBLY_ACC=CAM_ASM_000211 /LENGTH=155 /DNA_ID=CAMNT_0001499415 /DNA_START=303 /DNA_END=770 /DNA_ORIENTATION=-